MGDIERLARKIVERDPDYKHLYGERKERAVQYEYRRLWRVIFAIYPCLRKDRKQSGLFPPKRD